MAYQDYYQTLGVSKTASHDQIKKAWRKIVSANHSDRKPGDKAAYEIMIKANEAFDVLGDKEKRAHYDRFGFYDEAEQLEKMRRAKERQEQWEREQKAKELQKIRDAKLDYISAYLDWWPRNTTTEAQAAAKAEEIFSSDGIRGLEKETRFYEQMAEYHTEINSLGLRPLVQRYDAAFEFCKDLRKSRRNSPEADAAMAEIKQGAQEAFDGRNLADKIDFYNLYRKGGQGAINAEVAGFQVNVEKFEQKVAAFKQDFPPAPASHINLVVNNVAKGPDNRSFVERFGGGPDTRTHLQRLMDERAAAAAGGHSAGRSR